MDLLQGQVAPLRFDPQRGVEFIDQRKLPLEKNWIKASSYEDIYHIIRDMVVRGAPAISIAAAFGMALTFDSSLGQPDQAEVSHYRHELGRARARLASSRPTAVNLFWALDRVQEAFDAHFSKIAENVLRRADVHQFLLEEALRIWAEDIESNQAMSAFGAGYLPDGGVLTHCNAGALATGGLGTALGVIRKKFHDSGKIHVYVDETRPYLQGARLTAYELFEDGIPITLISDNMAAMVMSQGKVQAVVVGADRIAANGDTANKIGTMGVAILANHFHIPFYVAAPLATFDLQTFSGREIPIEERASRELTHIQDRPFTAEYPVYNPGFDVTPSSLISAIFTEQGVIEKPSRESVAHFFAKIMKSVPQS